MQEKNKRLGECLEREVDGGVELFDTENGDAWIWSDRWVDASEKA